MGQTKLKQVQISDLAAESVLANNTGSATTPVAIALGEQTLLGRITGGHVVGLTVTNIKTLLAYAIGDLTTVAANTVMVNATAGSAVITAMSVPASTFVGRIASGNIIAMTVAQANTLLGDALLAGATFTGSVLFRVGTATAGQAPAYFQGTGVLLTIAVAGAIEYDSINSYITNETTTGRGAIPVEQHFKLTAAGTAISGISNYFGSTSNIPLVANAYYNIEMWLWFLKTTSSTIVWTLTNSSAPTAQNIFYEMTPSGGLVTPPGDNSILCGEIYNDTTAAKTITTATIVGATNQYAYMNIFLKNGAGTSLKIQATSTSGTITPGIGSMWKSKRISANNVGAFAA